MATLRDIRTRIGSVQNTQQVTRAMKMVAAAKLRRAQENIFKTRPYAYKIGEIIEHLKRQGAVDAHPLLRERREVNAALIVVVSGDRGLAGAFNSNAIKTAEALIASEYSELHSNGTLHIVGVGRKGAEYFTKRNYNVVADLSGVFRELNYETAQSVGALAREGFMEGRWDEVKLVYNEFKNTIAQNRIVEPLIPIPPERFQTPVMQQEDIATPEIKERYRADYLFEPDSAQILDTLVPRFVNFTIWRALLESCAAEHGARMVAMDNATSNATELLRALRLQYNRARQSAITTEILEIISGANALEEAT
ncbi:MAG: ATP synthase F1 subunit gamma [Bacteroidetes bacterium]|nr:ATP synthase F1 subunit gamma [Bacteroidota bacterium]MDE2672662.1 ATP synthase F1 subunit gamma [Bacteroidota bacterium]